MKSHRTLVKILALLSLLSGCLVLVFVVTPIISYRQKYSNKFNRYLSPVPQREEKVYRPLDLVRDYTKASNWFNDSLNEQDFISSNIGYYQISIPKLEIEKAVVAIGGDDLSQYLIQYPGTALPGKRGNAVIFGHSILPQFYNPQDYMAIFSTLPTLEKGDEVLVDYDGVVYKYVIEDLFEVSPGDIQVLEQNLSDSFLSLVTCVPPGHPFKPKRLIVRARVDLFSQADASFSH